ncbi:MAG: hypothetical protein R6V49_10500, partial [Bacteroidales bacterium]
METHFYNTMLTDLENLPGDPAVILVAPLNWGLGHATRSADLITRLQHQFPKATLILASDGAALSWLQSRFPDLKTLRLPSYHITYPKGSAFIARMALSAPRLLLGILREHRQIKKIVRDCKVDLIVSDNRFGCWNKRCRSVIVTHQVSLASPGGVPYRLIMVVVNRINRWFISRFDRCWIPDYEKPPGLAGALSHPRRLPSNCTYIGPLSRFRGFKQRDITGPVADLVCIVSGPEPQRTIFFELLLNQLTPLPYHAIVFAGIPGSKTPWKPHPHITVIPDPDDAMVYNAIKTAKLVISRPGYSTIMDLWAIGDVLAAFVPTPGQTEQEYLA